MENSSSTEHQPPPEGGGGDNNNNNNQDKPKGSSKQPPRTLKNNNVCTRCQKKMVAGSECCVPHPFHLQQFNGSQFQDRAYGRKFTCLACQKDYVKTTRDMNCTDFSKLTITTGPVWCYQGSHTTEPLPDDDKRRATMETVELPVGESSNLQQRLDELDGKEDIRVLKIGSENGFYDGTSKPKIALRLPNLEELYLYNVEVEKLQLTTELTPKVKKIYMMNPTEEEDPDFTIELPELRDFTCYHYGPGGNRWLVLMLQKATKLQRFESSEMMVEDSLGFYSNCLQSIRLHRADGLAYVEIWAPQLTYLDIQGSCELEEIKFLETHKLEQELPAGWLPKDFKEELVVNGMSPDMPPKVLKAIKAHRRFRKRKRKA